MGKRQSRSDADHHSCACAGGEAKRPRPEQKHLYLALDDWEKGYNLYKVDVHAFGSADTQTESQLAAEPPVFQLEAAKGARDVLFAAVGTDILALWQPRYETTRTAVYDTVTGRLDAAGPRHPRALQPMRFVASAGTRGLYALHGGGMHFLERRGGEATTEPRWTWTTACSSLRLPFEGMQPGSPRRTIEITSYAMHPDGRTVFVSASGKRDGTFSFSLDDDNGGEWTRRGSWLLPFHGQGHYDAKLRAWVGLHSAGHVCACDVPSTTTTTTGVAAETSQPPAWQLVNAEHLFQEDHPELGGTSLVSTGDAGFCIVELQTPKGMHPVWDRDEIDEYVLRVTRFRLKHDRHGQLRASSTCRGASYRVRKHDPVFAPQAFWM